METTMPVTNDASKFFPPIIDSSQCVLRSRVINYLTDSLTDTTKIITVEAQAGQGKTIFIKQFLDHQKTEFLWFKIAREDIDPLKLLEEFQNCLKSFFPGFKKIAIKFLPEHNAINYDLISKTIDIYKNVIEINNKEIFFVIDDIHLIDKNSSSFTVIKSIIENSPRWMRFILSSREQIDVSDDLIATNRVCPVDNDDLSLDENEITDFLSHVCGLDLPERAVRQLLVVTEGWFMGLGLLGAQASLGDKDFISNISADTVLNKEFSKYFRRELLASIPERWHKAFLLFSLLDEIHLSLARLLAGNSEVADFLLEFSTKNLFLRAQDRQRQTFAFHHLCGQFLRERANSELSEDEKLAAYQSAGQFWRRENQNLKALNYLVMAQDYEATEELIKSLGLSFVYENKSASVAEILSQVPEPELSRFGWLALCLALSKIDTAPVAVLPILNNALSVFSQQKDDVGELVCLGFIMSLNILATGDYKDAEGMLGRASQLFFNLSDSLDDEIVLVLARSLAMGYGAYVSDFVESTRFANLALDLSRKHRLEDFEASLLMVHGYIQIFSGNHIAASAYQEQAHQMLQSSHLGMFNKLSIRMMLFNYLIAIGDAGNYFDQKNYVIDLVGHDLFHQSIAGKFCYVWEMDIAINRGSLTQALNLAEQALVKLSMSPHLRSQILHLKAYALARLGHDQEALALADESRRLRSMACGWYFIILNNILTGCVEFLCGKTQRGLELLELGITGAHQMPTAYLEVCGRLHRAEFLIEQGKLAAARADVEIGLELMERNRYLFFWGWSPNGMKKVLSFAARKGIQLDYAKRIARHCLNCDLMEDGSFVPLLQIGTLGGLKISLGSEDLLGAEDFTPAQRELLGLLLASPELKIPSEKIAVHLWPDSTSDAIKVTLDTLVSRLRKTLAEALPKTISQSYFFRGKGMIWLKHCRVDVVEFMRFARNGVKHARMQEFWQAGNAFSDAYGYWQGGFLLEVSGDEEVAVYRDTVQRQLSEMVCIWSGILEKDRRYEKAIQVLETALLGDLFNEELYARLYQIKGKFSALSARKTLNRFSDILQKEGYPPREIDELINTITERAHCN